VVDFLNSERFRHVTHNALRIVAGAAFLTHGGQKLFGWFGAQGPRVEPFEYLIAGILEFGGGLAIMLGLFTQPIAFIIAGEMAVAYFWKHAPGREGGYHLWWWVNRGEVVMLFSFIWLFFSAHGAGSFSLDAWLAKRRKSATTP